MSTPREFLTTRWSIVLAAQDGSSRDAMERLCRNYWYPLYAYVRRAGDLPEDAQDLTQEFFARLLAKSWLDEVKQERGRFLSWLLAAMRHFLTNEWHRSRTQKRGGGAVVFALDSEDAERRYHEEPSPDAAPDELYDRRWALTLIDTVLERLGGEFSVAGKAALFAELRGDGREEVVHDSNGQGCALRESHRSNERAAEGGRGADFVEGRTGGRREVPRGEQHRQLQN